MTSKLTVLATLCVALSLGISQADATIYTDTAIFDADAGFGLVPGPLPFTSLVDESDAGRVLTNSIMSPSAVGGEVRTIGVTVIQSAKVGGLLMGGISKSVADMPHILVAIYGLDGTVGPTMDDITYHTGRLQINLIPAFTFDPNDPETWGFGGMIEAEYTLKPKEDIKSGTDLGIVFAEPISSPASDVNVSGVNTAIGGNSQGLYIFREDPTSDLLDSDGKTANGETLADILLNQSGFQPVESLILSSDQEVVSLTESILDAADEAILNAIGMYSFGKDFADFSGGGGADEFKVSISGGTIIDGGSGLDFITNMGGNAIPGLQVVPEPTSALLSLIGMMMVLCGRRRR